MAARAGTRARADTHLGEVAHARLIGNQLQELDRFLSVLIDEASRGAEAGEAERPLRNTARKLRQAAIMTGADEARLRAIGRIAAVFRHCGGIIHNVAIHDDLRLVDGLKASAAGASGRGTRLHLAPMTVVAICDFYRQMGARLLTLAARPGAAP
ncbi:MAG TPA: hypothetical protein VNS79_14200 [Sphingobium sp.]|nr:hypothetical protein [Sphingobium sp.]